MADTSCGEPGDISLSGAIMTECQLCLSRGPHEQIAVREMMIGTREYFSYSLCLHCGSLQLARTIPPDELARYYGSSYYSYEPRRTSFLRKIYETSRDRGQAGSGGGALGVLAAKIRPEPTLQLVVDLPISRNARILDIGCGRGALLSRLADVGFTNLVGVDPLVPEDRVAEPGFRLFKMYLEELQAEPFDVIMFHHSLEHVPDLNASLRNAYDRLVPGGICLVRLPTTSSEAWARYREDWVQIDAPRHFVIPSREGMVHSARRAGFELLRIIDDSTEFQFRGSEKFLRDSPLRDPDASFGDRQIRKWKRQAKALNRAGRGDQAAFLFQKPQAL